MLGESKARLAPWTPENPQALGGGRFPKLAGPRAHFGAMLMLTEKRLDQGSVAVGGGPDPAINQLQIPGQVTALPKPQFPNEMNLLTPGLASSGDQKICGRECLAQSMTHRGGKGWFTSRISRRSHGGWA